MKYVRWGPISPNEKERKKERKFRLEEFPQRDHSRWLVRGRRCVTNYLNPETGNAHSRYLVRIFTSQLRLC